MKKLTSKIMNANFKKLWIRYLVICLCAALVGGGVSAALLRPQIREVVNTLEEEEQGEVQNNTQNGEKDINRENTKGEKKWKDEKRWEHLSISEPTTAAKAAVGITSAAALVLLAAYWLLTAAWVYRLAAEADMNALIWCLLTLVGNLGAVVLFFALRSALRTPCPGCGHYQKKAAFCRRCGTAMERCCPNCGGKAAPADLFCSVCGNQLEK